MTYLYLLLVLHLVFGVVCASVANESEHHVKAWYLAGTVFGGLALIALIAVNYFKHLPVVRAL
ncbi:MAG: hypothetical protein HOE48_23315 [Candidatus Latescibacteria bacterium]|jgi:hypothetical protein|nr:hypothetical protein [Candidatus Latescibacterota bacterium]MBT4140861.1 hypothetical protein [Candidatus Latescibacterota bacterium]MBT5832880.1 hypothetical protein [Candidatus Latescibacterota bacterium]